MSDGSTPTGESDLSRLLHADRRAGVEQGALRKPVHTAATYGYAKAADLVAVFILPPSRGELHSRLTSRAQDSAEVVAKRMAKASDEMSHWPEYDYVVVNDEVNEAHQKLRAILTAERMKRDRQTALPEFVTKLREEG